MLYSFFYAGKHSVYLKIASRSYERWRGINPQANGGERENVHAAKKEDSLPVLRDDNGRGTDPDRFVNIYDRSLEHLDCPGFVRDLEREDIHAVFC